MDTEVDDGAALERAEAAYAVGDVAEATRIACRLEEAVDPEVRAAARRLLRASSPDWVEIAVIVACLVGLSAITWHYLL